MIFEHF